MSSIGTIELTYREQAEFLLAHCPAVLSASWDEDKRRGRATFGTFAAARRAEHLLEEQAR